MRGAGPVVLPRNTRSANTRDEASKRLAKSHLSRRRKWREITAPGYSLLACPSAQFGPAAPFSKWLYAFARAPFPS